MSMTCGVRGGLREAGSMRPSNSGPLSPHLAGPLQALAQLLHALAPDELFALATAPDKVVDLGHGPVEDGNSEPPAFHVEDEVLAHDGESYEPDISRHCCAGSNHGIR
jgi:hypothetical protein